MYQVFPAVSVQHLAPPPPQVSRLQSWGTVAKADRLIAMAAKAVNNFAFIKIIIIIIMELLFLPPGRAYSNFPFHCAIE
ncbi:hypothetical protein BC349_11625 [Flavihumibacter stibioxidans]|uniref:Uncharacterized protein n=1 Tax=Flavihumibacter stibioxidans TaxID=1834163 RepID=A0ABR7M9R8_9BACT|nr:hypothetical protein [Flavihumibacter stibioxidans]